MAAIAERFVTIRPDTKAFRRDLEKDTTEDAKAVGLKLSQALAGGAFLAGAKKAVDAASALQQAVGGTTAVFGEAQGAVDDFAKGAAESAGLSERAARELTSTLGGLLKGFGFTESEAADLSITLAKLGGDLAATFGGTPEEAVQALGAALRGETDPIERYGISLNQAAVGAKAVELGLASSASAVDANAKAQATLALITERSADAQGQFAREIDTAAGQAAVAAAKTENAAADLGTNLLPIYTKISEIVGTVAGAFGALPEPVQTAVIALGGIAALSGPIKVAGEAIATLAQIARTQLVKGLDTAAEGAYSLSGNLGKAAGVMGAFGLAAVAAEIAISSYNDTQAEAEAMTAAFAEALTESNGALDENTRALVTSALLKGELGEALRESEANVARLTTGVFDNADAVTQLNDKYKALVQGGIGDPLRKALEDAGLAGSALGDELLAIAESGDLTQGQMIDLIDRLNDTAEGYKTGAREADNKAAADEAAGDAAGTAAPKIQDQADALDANEAAAKAAADSVDLFREAVDRALEPLDREEAIDNFNQALLDQAQAIEDRATAVADAQTKLDALRSGKSEAEADKIRDVADAQRALTEATQEAANNPWTDEDGSKRADAMQNLADAEAALAEVRASPTGGPTAEDIAAAERDLTDAMAEQSLTLDGNSEAALRNREALREIIDRGVEVITTARDQGASLEELKGIRDIEIQSLKDQLTQMGYNKTDVDRYVETLNKIPLTKATTVTVETAEAEAKLAALQAQVDRLITTGDDPALAARLGVRIGREAAKGHAAGGHVTDGVFTVGERGTEVLTKHGNDVNVLTGGGLSAAGFDAVGEDQLLTQREMASLLRQIATNTTGATSLRRVALEGAV